MNKKEELLALIHGNGYRGMHAAQLSRALDMEDSASFTQLMKLLNDLEAEHILARDAKERYFTSEELGYVTGTLRINPKGFGFVETADTSYYIGRDHLGLGMDRDIVFAKTWTNNDKSVEGEVIEVLEHSVRQLVGTVKIKEGRKYFLSDAFLNYRKVRITNFDDFRLVNDSKVLLGIDSYGTVLKCHIEKEIGYKYDPGIDILSVLLEKDINPQFPEDVMQEVQQIPETIQEDDIAQRKDLRKLLTITIDGEDAKDLDDAVSVSFDGTYYHLGVHIADVTNYVQENSALDREALKRGTSVYLVDRVIPMLPHALSNGICSLNEGVDRLALSCLMKVDEEGEIVDYEICESVIRVNKRMSYTVVKKLLEEPECVEHNADMPDGTSGEGVETSTDYSQYRELLPMFQQMAELADKLRKKRQKRGSIDFDFPECKILLDKEGHPLDIKPYERNIATMLIEDFMLAANETVAQHFYWQELPFVYRVHDVPDPERIQKLSTFISNYGYYMKALGRRNSKVSTEEIHPKEIQKLLQKIEGTPEEPMIARLTLRSMKQAKYSTECTGHFGLACQYYCHFTSPIRRYPDLQIHRIIKEQLRGRLKEERVEHYRDILPEVAKHSSEMERRADEAERETDKLKKVEYMEQHIGEEYEGVISGVTGWGLYVELPNTVEGLIHISTIPGDYYHYNEAACEMVGEATGRCFKLGMPVRIEVEDCDRFMRTINFRLVDK